jgi:uncharacterized protein YbjT (DUF2867 family)
MNRTLLITGANGSVSSALRAALEGSDRDIRALIRDEAKAASLRTQGVQVVVGDLDDPGSLPPAFEGVQDLWLLVPNGPRAAENSMNAVWAARQAGVERVVRLSAVGSALDAPTRSGRLHALSDHELQMSGMRWTILRPHWFMQNLLNEAGDISARGAFSFSAGDGRLGMIDVRDVAEFAARVLTDGAQHHDGKIYTPTGPQSVSFADVAERLTRILGRPVDYLPVSDDIQRKTLLEYGIPAWIVGMLVEYSQAYAAGWGDHTTSDFVDVVGHAPRSVDDFIRDHVAAFS